MYIPCAHTTHQPIGKIYSMQWMNNPPTNMGRYTACNEWTTHQPIWEKIYSMQWIYIMQHTIFSWFVSFSFAQMGGGYMVWCRVLCCHGVLLHFQALGGDSVLHFVVKFTSFLSSYSFCHCTYSINSSVSKLSSNVSVTSNVFNQFIHLQINSSNCLQNVHVIQ